MVSHSPSPYSVSLKDGSDAIDFYNKRLEEDTTIGSVQLMDEYAKHIIEINFCDGSPIEFDNLSVGQLRTIHGNINKCVDWVNKVEYRRS